MQDLRTELTESLDEATWDWLMPHAKRDSVIVVSPELDLLDVGVAIASDNTTSVQHWIAESLIAKPSPDQLANWNDHLNQRFTALIVQPYVLVQELE
ncbi:MAG: DUF2288 domain-containing protein [Scytolyngbya sp. HA4215-MV1]|jgi:hypothetical protein|nr:DUF2288 domain-containing protein [Scytolyngbya sp. HA4215-MV1]